MSSSCMEWSLKENQWVYCIMFGNLSSFFHFRHCWSSNFFLKEISGNYCVVYALSELLKLLFDSLVLPLCLRLIIYRLNYELDITTNLPHTLLSYCRQVATGMSYLSNKLFIHGDLAARNILVSEDGACKVNCCKQCLYLEVYCLSYELDCWLWDVTWPCWRQLLSLSWGENTCKVDCPRGKE